MKALAAGVLLLAATLGPVHAQSSATYRLSESTLNAGGHPSQGLSMASASNRVSLDAIGDTISGGSSSSASYQLGAGFSTRYRSPGEIGNLRFQSRVALLWDDDPSTGTYNVYRDTLSTLPAGAGACLQSGIQGASYIASAVPTTGTGWFFLVTAENLLGEEGTLGTGAGGLARAGVSTCP